MVTRLRLTDDLRYRIAMVRRAADRVGDGQPGLSLYQAKLDLADGVLDELDRHDVQRRRRLARLAALPRPKPAAAACAVRRPLRRRA